MGAIRHHLAYGPSCCGCLDAPWVPTEPSVFTPAPPLPSGARPDWVVRDAERERHPQEIADERRAFAEAARQREMPMADSSEPEWESGGPRWMAHLRKAAQEEAVRKMTEHLNQRVWTPPDAPQLTLEDFGWPKSCAHGDDCCLPECCVEVRTYRQCEMYKPRPAPAVHRQIADAEDWTEALRHTGIPEYIVGDPRWSEWLGKIAGPKPSPAENAKRYTREDGTW